MKKQSRLTDLPDRTVSANESAEAFSKGFENALDMKLEPYDLSEEQLRYVKEIERKNMANDEWTFKK